MKRSQLERYIKQAIKEAMHIDSQGNLHSDDDKIKRAGEDKDQLIYHKGEEIKQRAFFDDKINLNLLLGKFFHFEKLIQCKSYH